MKNIIIDKITDLGITAICSDGVKREIKFHPFEVTESNMNANYETHTTVSGKELDPPKGELDINIKWEGGYKPKAYMLDNDNTDEE